ncbi:unknown [Firmicutes bacterium CAG:95]|nr:unknown [Firmicutes bacterium CAG:95]
MLNDTLNDDESDQSEYEEDENDDFSGFDKEAF